MACVDPAHASETRARSLPSSYSSARGCISNLTTVQRPRAKFKTVSSLEILMVRSFPAQLQISVTPEGSSRNGFIIALLCFLALAFLFPSPGRKGGLDASGALE